MWVTIRAQLGLSVGLLHRPLVVIEDGLAVNARAQQGYLGVNRVKWVTTRGQFCLSVGFLYRPLVVSEDGLVVHARAK